jgi:hypothetical protein
VLAIRICLLAALFILFLQDLKTRSVHWFLFLVIALLMGLLQYQQYNGRLNAILVETIANLIFLGMMLILLTLSLSVRYRRWINITNSFLGWGDILFLLILIYCLSFFNYVFFYLVSILTALVWGIAAQLLGRRKNTDTIPLAGLQALVFIVYLTISWWCPVFNLNVDIWMFRLLH